MSCLCGKDGYEYELEDKSSNFSYFFFFLLIILVIAWVQLR